MNGAAGRCSRKSAVRGLVALLRLVRGQLVSRSPCTRGRQGGHSDLIGGPLVIRLTGDSGPVVVRIARGAALAVHVMDDRGAAVPAATVALVDEAGAWR